MWEVFFFLEEKDLQMSKYVSLLLVDYLSSGDTSF